MHDLFRELEQYLPEMDKNLLKKLAENWIFLTLETAEDAILEWENIRDEQAAYDLVVAWSRLKRMDPQRVKQYDTDDISKQLDTLLKTDAERIISAAISVVDPGRWLADIQSLQDERLELEIDPEESSVVVSEALEEIDNAELVIYAASTFGIDVDEHLTENLEKALDWTVSHPEVFLPADGFIRTLVSMLPETLDPDLILTLGKFHIILQETALAWKEMTAIEPLPEKFLESILGTDTARSLSSLLQRLHKKYAEPVIKKAIELPNTLGNLQPVHAFGSAPATMPGKILMWESVDPDKTWQVFAHIPSPARLSENSRIMFVLNNYPNARFIYVKGIQKKWIPVEGTNNMRADFTLKELQQLQDRPDLPTLAIEDRDGDLSLGDFIDTSEGETS